MVEVGRGLDRLPPPALVIGGVPFHLVQQRLEEPIYHSIDSEHYSDLSSLGSSLSSSGNSGRPREVEEAHHHNQQQARVQEEQFREAGDAYIRNYPLTRAYYLRPQSSQSVQYSQPTQLFQPPEWRSSSLPGPWRPGPPCPPYANRSSMEEGRGEVVGSPQAAAVTSL